MKQEFNSGQNFNPSEDKTRLDPAQEAENLLKILKEIEGRKALVLIVDDMPEKREDTEELLTEASAARDTSYVVSSKPDGHSAIRLYQEFRRQEPKEEQNKVIVILDGELNDRSRVYNHGEQVAEKLFELSTENEWEAPYLIGMSNNPLSNQTLKDTYPQNYIDTFIAWYPDAQKTAFLDAIDSRLTPPQAPPQK